ncbi:MAG TPA: efflux RND transporter periplasmic adaptor subunit [Candidatus Sulfotelmatobacter sp.]|nr:efflux RND transporter periplasmic adaptor subunit [Candidatus Sulfotelmatobacter sp.]
MNTVPPVLQRPGASKVSRRNRRIFIFLGIVVAFVALAGLLVLGKRTPPIIVQTEKVARRNVTQTVVANGKIQPVVQVTISPEVSGEIIQLPVHEGQRVKKGDLLVKINPDVYTAALNQAKAGYESAVASAASAQANLEKAQDDYDRNLELFHRHLVDESDFDQFKMARDTARAQLDSAKDQMDVQKAEVDSAQASLDKTTIVSPLNGTVTELNCQLGDRVLGTVENVGTVIMIVSDLSKMEARVDVGEMDVVGIKPGQKATLDVDAFQDKKFTGVVTDVASSSLDNDESAAVSSSGGGSGQTQEATKFEVRIRIKDKEDFRPGMSVSADIETVYRTNVLTVPLASVTTRSITQKADPPGKGGTNSIAAATNSAPTFGGEDGGKVTDVVFVVQGDHVKAEPVTIGICDDNYWEITSGLSNSEEIVSGGYRAISRDLKDGAKIKKGQPIGEAQK